MKPILTLARDTGPGAATQLPLRSAGAPREMWLESFAARVQEKQGFTPWDAAALAEVCWQNAIFTYGSEQATLTQGGRNYADQEMAFWSS